MDNHVADYSEDELYDEMTPWLPAARPQPAQRRQLPATPRYPSALHRGPVTQSPRPLPRPAPPTAFPRLEASPSLGRGAGQPRVGGSPSRWEHQHMEEDDWC